LRINRFGEIDDAASRQKLRRRDRHAKRQRVTSDQTAVTLRPPTAETAHQAKPAQKPDNAIGKANQQAGADDDAGGGIHGLPSQ
jgi:hypothetical protein